MMISTASPTPPMAPELSVAAAIAALRFVTKTVLVDQSDADGDTPRRTERNRRTVPGVRRRAVARVRSVCCRVPVHARAHRHLQRDGQRIGTGHLLPEHRR